MLNLPQRLLTNPHIKVSYCLFLTVKTSSTDSKSEATEYKQIFNELVPTASQQAQAQRSFLYSLYICLSDIFFPVVYNQQVQVCSQYLQMFLSEASVSAAQTEVEACKCCAFCLNVSMPRLINVYHSFFWLNFDDNVDNKY